MAFVDTTPIKQSGSNYQRHIEELLALADISTDGQRPWDLKVHNPKLFERIVRDGSVGFGEAYMDGWWDCDALDAMFTRLLGEQLQQQFKGPGRWKLRWLILCSLVLNLQSKSRAYEVGEAHYDIGNDLYALMLDSTMTYSCGYWRDAKDLESAQFDKMDLICRKLKLQPGMTLLDIGCGWGGLAAHAAKHYGVKVTGITISREQADYVRDRYADLPIEVSLTDYRELQGNFDRIVSVGMFEHVGHKNYREFFQIVRNLLSDSGLFLLHTIGEEKTTYTTDPFVHKYIFPNGKVASRKHVSHASLHLLRLEDWHNFGPDYDKTLMSWAKNFEQNWHKLASSGDYNQRFYRMWRYYLYSCAGYFRSRKGQLWQMVFSHPNSAEPYVSER